MPGLALGQDAGGLTPQLGGAEVVAVTSTGQTVDQTSHRLVFEALRETVRAGPADLNTGSSVRYRASALVYLLLLGHPVDEWGRCRSCPGVMTGLRPRPCKIHFKASEVLLHYPDEALLLAHLAEELGTSRVPPGSAAGAVALPGLIVRARVDPDGTDVLPTLTGESHPDPSLGGS